MIRKHDLNSGLLLGPFRSTIPYTSKSVFMSGLNSEFARIIGLYSLEQEVGILGCNRYVCVTTEKMKKMKKYPAGRTGELQL